MKLKSKIVKLSIIVLCVLGSLAIVSFIWRGNSPDGRSSSGMGIFLARPAFAQGDEMSFLEEEAGISAYTNLGQSINLTAAKKAFRTVEKETSLYIVGSVPVPGYEDNAGEDVHCFIHKDGWVVAYYLRHEPTGKIMYWKNWDKKTISTKVEEGLTAAASTTGLAPTDVKYYHFRYPDANKLMMVVDVDAFKLTIPGELAVHERSYSLSAYSFINIDGNRVGSGTYVSGFITLSQLKPDVSHDIVCYSNGAVIALVYQES